MGLIECYHNAHLSVLFTTVSFGTGYVHDSVVPQTNPSCKAESLKELELREGISHVRAQEASVVFLL